MSNAQIDHKLVETLAKLEPLEHEAKLDMIFQWVKTGHISRTIFKRLLGFVMATTHESASSWAAENGYTLAIEQDEFNK